MAAERRLDLVCVSYLADTLLLGVAAYPPANSGVVVERIATSIAADGPLTALTAAGLGLRVGLVANAVGADPPGRRILDVLDEAGIRHAIAAVPDAATPQMTVVVDDNATRTWFASLQRAAIDLSTANLHLLADARLIYVDCYQILTVAAARAIAAAGAVPLLLNLGGDPVDDTIIAATAGRHVAAVQTSMDEADAAEAESLAGMLLDRLHPDTALVTLGRLGALARTRTRVHRAAAPPVLITHTHGAGAAFSAGYAHALLRGADIDTALHAACRAGTAACTGPCTTTPTPAIAAT